MASTSPPAPDRAAGAMPGWLSALLMGVFAMLVTGGVTTLVVLLYFMPAAESEQFVWRRLHDEPPLLAAAVPIAFALMVLTLVVLFRREGRMQALIVALIVIT